MVAYIKNFEKLFHPKNIEVVDGQFVSRKSNQYLFNLLDLKAKRYWLEIAVTPMTIKHLR